MEPIELVVFDLAGTTIADNSEVHQAFIRAFADEGMEVSYDEANAAMGIAKPVAIRTLLESRNESDWDDHTVSQIHDRFVVNILDYYRTSDEVREQDGTSELFQWLKSQGIKIAIDTGFDRQTTDLLLDRVGWLKRGLLDASVCSDEVENGRPEPDMVFKLMQELNVTDVSKVVKVGDTPVDLQEGSNANCRYVVGIYNTTHSREQLLSYPHTHLIERLVELKTVLLPTLAKR